MSKKPVTLWKTALESDELSCPVEGQTEGYAVIPVFGDDSGGGIPCRCGKEEVRKFVWLVLPNLLADFLGPEDCCAEALCLECFAKSLAIVEE